MFKIVSGKEKIKSNGGFSIVGLLIQSLRLHKIENDKRGRKPIVSDCDILKSYIGLQCQSYNSFESVSLFSDSFFNESLGVKNVPTNDMLRHRIDSFSGSYDESLIKANTALLRHVEFGRIITKHDSYVPYDFDVSVLDNSGSKKAGCERTYKNNTDGFAPMFSYIGTEGYMLGSELRRGSQHCQEGTPAYLQKDIEKMKELGLTLSKILVRCDSGNDAVENLLLFLKYGLKFIVKRNPRKESKEMWKDTAEAHGGGREMRKGKIYYCGMIYHKIPANNEKAGEVPIVYEVTVRTIDRKGQRLLLPDIEVNTYWTNLILETPEDIVQLYHDHGTSEQFHSELKSDMGIERLPSQKFSSNSTILLMANIAYNILRIIGQESIAVEDDMPIEKTMKRRRLRNVLRDIIYVGCKFVKHAGATFLNFGCESPWFKVIRRLYLKFA